MGAAYIEYAELRDAMLNERRAGRNPPPAHYGEIDAHLFLLPAPELILEYRSYAAMYLDEGEQVAVRGFCEVRLARLGEMLHDEQSIRIARAQMSENTSAIIQGVHTSMVAAEGAAARQAQRAAEQRAAAAEKKLHDEALEKDAISGMNSQVAWLDLTALHCTALGWTWPGLLWLG
jgi:hypothetical protein